MQLVIRMQVLEFVLAAMSILSMNVHHSVTCWSKIESVAKLFSLTMGVPLLFVGKAFLS
jgi:hypothetical protein